ncbi:PH domain-containing protein [Sinomonas mesophila]|uniref:PH domain-containing protein n=1 Tax=Sinomonas mesophila TaxID=1531955 RepID=UPI0011159962|nr:PH domain-containing protein [Sinomonas mesophila]
MTGQPAGGPDPEMGGRDPAAGGPDAPGRLEPTHDGAWRRVHPLSPFVRGWILLLALFIGIGRDWFEAVLSGRPAQGWWERVPPPLLGAAGAAVVVLVGAGFLLSWWTTRFQVGHDTVRVRTGIVFRQHRQARLDRVQAVDLAQPLLARLFGLAELRIEVADAGESALRLAFLRLSEAEHLREAVMAAAARARRGAPVPGAPGHGGSVPTLPAAVPSAAVPSAAAASAAAAAADHDEALVVAVPVARVLASTALSAGVVGSVLAAGAAAAAQALTGVPFVPVMIVPAALAAVASAWGRVTESWNFRVLATREGLRLRYGLLEARSQTVPEGRIQAISIRQPLLWRPAGWWSVRVNVAGYGGASRQAQGKSMVLPVGGAEDVFRVLSLVLPDPGTEGESARDVVLAGLAGSGPMHGFTTPPPAARWLDPFAWRRTGVRATRTALLCRSGVLTRELSLVPHERTQSLALRQGPLERSLGLAGVELHSTPGPVRPSVRHLSVEAAERLFAEQAARAAAARRRPPGQPPEPHPEPNPEPNPASDGPTDDRGERP